MKLRTIVAGALAVTCIVALSACKSSGSASKSSSTAQSNSAAASAGGSSSAPSGLASAKAIVAANGTEPTEIPIKTALPKAPEKGIKVAFLTCSAAACSLLNPGFTAAATALGWDPTIITYNSATPGQALQQAIDAGYKYIATTSISLNTVTPQIAEAKAKGIAIFGAYTNDVAGGATNGLYGVAQSPAAGVLEGKLMAAWTIVDSNSNANVVFVDLPIYPTLVGQGDAAKAEYSADCSACTFDTLGLSVTQLGAGQGPSAIVSYLQSHPKVNYVYLSFQDLDAGVAAALKTAGLTDKVKIVGTEGQAAQLKAVVAGTEQAWTILPEPYVMWVVVDWMARLSENVLTPDALSATDAGLAFMVDTPDKATAQLSENGGDWAGPANYDKQFEKLWQVAS